MTTEISTFIVDSFTDQVFKGNPAGVCLVEKPLTETEMQSIAMELNLSETAFVQRSSDYWAIRYFSPKVEIPLCGHATLASAKVLIEKFDLVNLTFQTGQGLELFITRDEDKLVMRFPRYEYTSASVPKGMLEALGLDHVLHAVYCEATNMLLFEIENAETLRNLRPDFNALVQTNDTIHGLVVTAQGNDEYDFHSRYFWTWSGSDEDPVTGATHTFMAPYWAEKLGKTKLRSFQASARTGFMDLELKENQLLIKGSAVVVLEGKLFL